MVTRTTITTTADTKLLEEFDAHEGKRSEALHMGLAWFVERKEIGDNKNPWQVIQNFQKVIATQAEEIKRLEHNYKFTVQKLVYLGQNPIGDLVKEKAKESEQ